MGNQMEKISFNGCAYGIGTFIPKIVLRSICVENDIKQRS